MLRGEGLKGKMKILFVATSYPENPDDWRGRFVERLLNALSGKKGLEISAWAPLGAHPQNVNFDLTAGDAKWLKKLSVQGGIAHQIKSGPFRAARWGCELLIRLNRAFKRNHNADIYHINWLQNALSVPNNGKPLLVSVLGSDLKLLRLPGMKRALQYQFKRHPVVLAPNNNWMAPLLEKDFGHLARIRPVKFGIDEDFYRINRNVSSNPRIWLAVSRLTDDKLGPLFEWGKDCFGPDDQLHLLGPNQGGVRIPDWVNHHGPCGLDDLKQHWFPKISGLVSLSAHSEGMPQVILEAMAASVPVIASPIDAHSDVIRHGENGWLAGSRDQFASGLEWLSNENVNMKAGNAAREAIRSSCGTWDDAAERYMEIYEELSKPS